jgi:hypothetical protein
MAAPHQKAVPEPVEAAPTPEAALPTTAMVPAAPGAPTFAALYPGAAVDQPATTASGPDGDGGLVTFHTEATPDEVVAFYRARAEEAGLTSVMGMNQGDARAYGAAGGSNGATNIQVVAAPGEGDRTSVQLSWSAGQ